MIGFGLLVGHMIGDYILQNDWQAKNKVNSLCGKGKFAHSCDGLYFWVGPADEYEEWCLRRHSSIQGHLACTIHCLLYTLSVWSCSFWWMPWWGLLACFLIHWPVDRFRLAKWWMINVSGQKDFATGPLSPWSFIVVDNVFHLLVLFVIGVIAS